MVSLDLNSKLVQQLELRRTRVDVSSDAIYAIMCTRSRETLSDPCYLSGVLSPVRALHLVDWPKN